MSQVKITCSIKQAELINEALDLYSRLLMGQFDEILWLLRNRSPQFKKVEDDYVIVDLLGELKEIVMPDVGSGYYGIHSKDIDDSARVAYDIIQVIRNKIAFHRKPNGGISVDFQTPFKTSKELLCDVSIIDD